MLFATTAFWAMALCFRTGHLWRPELLDSIHNAFVATPDEGDRSFIDKFRDQIQPAGTDVIRLAAESLAVYFLFPSNVGGFRKRQVVNEVLGWVGDNLPETIWFPWHLNTGSAAVGRATTRAAPLRSPF